MSFYATNDVNNRLYTEFAENLKKLEAINEVSQQFKMAADRHDIETVKKLLNEDPKRVPNDCISEVFSKAIYQNRPGDVEVIVEISKSSGKLAGHALYNSTCTPSRFNMFEPLLDLIVRKEIEVSDQDKAVALRCAEILEAQDMVQKMENAGFPHYQFLPNPNFGFTWPTKKTAL